jgi:hypothetical protein
MDGVERGGSAHAEGERILGNTTSPAAPVFHRDDAPLSYMIYSAASDGIPAEAIAIHLRGTNTPILRDAALALKRGGVGFRRGKTLTNTGL